MLSRAENVDLVSNALQFITFLTGPFISPILHNVRTTPEQFVETALFCYCSVLDTLYIPLHLCES